MISITKDHRGGGKTTAGNKNSSKTDTMKKNSLIGQDKRPIGSSDIYTLIATAVITLALERFYALANAHIQIWKKVVSLILCSSVGLKLKYSKLFY